MILFINACARKDSRTLNIAKALLNRIRSDETLEEVDLYASKLAPMDEKSVEKRAALIEKGDFSDPMFDLAKQLIAADKIVIAAPYWDLSFPAALKTYIENIYVSKLVSELNGSGIPTGHCKANIVYYVTTAGGPYIPEYSYVYIESLFTKCFGVRQAKLIKAEMLDVYGFDAEKIVNDTITDIESGVYDA